MKFCPIARVIIQHLLEFIQKSQYFLKKMNQARIHSDEELPKQYFDLVQKVGSKGRYQTIVCVLITLTWMLSGALMLGQSILFLEPGFNCSGTKQQILECQARICSKSPMQWTQYLKEPEMQSVATEFGPFLCDHKKQLNLRKMSLFLGSLFGFVFIPTFSDNLGRRSLTLFLLGIETIGSVMLLFSPSIDIASIAIFFIGFGCETVMRVTLCIFSEIVENQKRQEYSILIELGYGIGGVLIGVLGWALKDWRKLILAINTAPLILIFFLTLYFLEQTPKFLIKMHGIDKTVEAMNRIAHINNGNNENPITQSDIKSVKQFQEYGESLQKQKQFVTPFHLCLYKSLRKNALISCMLMILINYLYFGPVIIMDKLGLTPFVSQVIVSSSEVIAYYPAYLFVHRLPRVRAGQVCAGISALLYGILIFIRPEDNCHCIEEIIEIVFIFVARFSISFYFSLLFLYVTEIFPLKVRVIGFGTASMFGAFASSSGQYIFTTLEDNHFNTMILFFGLSVLTIIVLVFAKETLDVPLEDQIEEIKEEKEMNQKFKGKEDQQNYDKSHDQ